MAADEGGKPDLKKLLSQILAKVEDLETQLAKERQARRDLEDKATETLTGYSEVIENLQRSQFAMLTMHLDIVGPRRTHSDPAVAQEATNHAKMAMEAQAWAAPVLFETLYGISAETGEDLPGREAGVALDRV